MAKRELSPFEQALHDLDWAPDGGYVLRILQVFRDEVGRHIEYAATCSADRGMPERVFDEVNRLKKLQAAELDKAIEVLEKLAASSAAATFIGVPGQGDGRSTWTADVR
jgi:hypothetical protein